MFAQVHGANGFFTSEIRIKYLGYIDDTYLTEPPAALITDRRTLDMTSAKIDEIC